jgi:hypothetical protein
MKRTCIIIFLHFNYNIFIFAVLVPGAGEMFPFASLIAIKILCLCCFDSLQDHRTALFWASMKGQGDVVKMLLQRGADANIKNKVCQ